MSRVNLHILSLLFVFLYVGNAEAFFFTKVPKLKKSHLVMGKSSTSALNPESIKVLVWNIHKGKDKGFYDDFTRLGEDRDILMIQELYNSKHVIDSLDHFLGFRFDVGISFRYRFKKHIYSGTMIGSHVEPSYTKISRSRDREPVVNTPKVLTIGSYPIEGHNDLLIINIHGMNVTSNKAFYRQIDDAIKSMSGHRGPIIFAGDFNTNRQKRIDYLQRNLVQRLGFKDMQFRNDERMKSAFTKLIIDFTFTRGLKVIDSEVLGKLKSSDHKAMYFEVAVDDGKSSNIASK
ncbi:MAG: endonuclease/exonuclease/phosphatase family protein [Bacteriovoracaceae bacterium]|nr:endonuclease/exonuclease/phosphatase family protein [Bacteriovoracaceae bacterium]